MWPIILSFYSNVVSDVDSFQFVRTFGKWKWPDIEQTQCVPRVKAQKAYSSLSVKDSQNYKKVKETALRACELVPEKFRNMQKPEDQ